MRKFLYKIGIYGLISFLLLNLTAFLSLYFMGQSYLYKPEYVRNGIKESKFDYVVLGSSTGLTTLNTNLIDSITGKKGLNISIDDTSMSTHYLMLKHFYACGKSTDTLILTITPWDSSDPEPSLNNNDYRFLPYVNEDYVYDYYNEMEKGYFKKMTLSRYFPIFGVSYYNIELFYPSLVTAIQPEKRNRFDEKGNYMYPEDGSKPAESKPTVSVVDIKNPFYLRIKEFCKRHKIKLILYQSPIYRTKIIYTERNNIINHSDLLPNGSYFYDNIHVNDRGRKFCSKSIGIFFDKKSNFIKRS